MAWPWWVLLAVVVVVLGLWLWWTAHRLDLMHHRIEVSRAALDAQLLRRSGVAVELATSGTLDPARSLLLVDAAHVARATSMRWCIRSSRFAVQDSQSPIATSTGTASSRRA